MAARSTDPEDYQRTPRPIAAMPKEFAPGFRITPHRHERAQLIYASAGGMTVATEAGVWAVPPLRAVWIPAATEHWLRMGPRPVAMRTLYIRADAAPGLPRAACVIAVSGLLRELILAAMEMPLLYDEAGRDGRVMALILDEIRALAVLPLHLPMPRSPRLARLCEALLAEPADQRSLEAWAAEAGIGARNLARLFRRETGMSFGGWRRQARLLAALARLAAGEPVTNVALELGYDSPSAFTAMFRRNLGVSPSRYFAPP